MYGKIKIALKYFLNFKFVLVTKKANIPPYNIATTHENTAKINVFSKGVHKLALATFPVNKST